MTRVRTQIQELHKSAPLVEQNKIILGVSRRMAELTVKGLAMNVSAVETVVRTALREPWNGPMALTKSIQDLFDVRRVDMATAPVSLRQLQSMLETRDHSQLGTDARSSDVRDIALHLCNELNSLPPLSKPVLAFLNQVNNTHALEHTTEEWTLAAWKEEFSNYNAQTPRDMNPVVFGLTRMHQKSPSLALAARPDALGTTELVHKVANNALVEELRNVSSDAKGNVVRALFQGDYDGARREVLLHRMISNTETLIVAPNLDTSELDNAGLAP